MKFLFSITAALLFYSFCYAGKLMSIARSEAQQETVYGDPAKDIPSTVELIPDGLGNYRSGQLSAADFETLLATGAIGVVCRMNGDGKNDQGELSTDQERAICKKYNVKYLTSSGVNFFDSHAGYLSPDQAAARGLRPGYSGAYGELRLHLMKGGVLVHCRYGFHRTGAHVGRWLKERGMSWSKIVSHNRWGELINHKTQSIEYHKYIETARNGG